MKAFELIYEEFHIPIFKFLMRLTGNQELSEELTQETFVQAYSSILRYNGRCSLFTWLCAIAKNCFLKHLRKNKRLVLNAELLQQEVVDGGADDPQLICEKQEIMAELSAALMDMKKAYRDVIILRIYFECSYKEIAQALHISESAAKVRYHRGIEMLRSLV